MKETILQRLRDIEVTENVEVLLAVESGSRAWGFASPDSDYDVRFIYRRPKEDYLKLEKHRDVIELPIDDVLDINGWDIDKTLILLRKSNPTIFEWKASPIVYKDNGFIQASDELFTTFFSPKRSLYHYLSMAKTNYRTYLKEDKVKAKKYFYVIRPLLACKWIQETCTQPPVPFQTLFDSMLPESLKPDVQRLLTIKVNADEKQLIDRVDSINRYIEENIVATEEYISHLPKETVPSWDLLNQFFLSVIS